MYVCMYVCVYIYIYIYMYMAMFIYTCMLHVCKHVYVYVSVCVDVYMYTCVCIHVYVNMYIYGHALRGPPLPGVPPAMVYGAGCPPSCGMECGFPLPPVGWLWGFWGFGSSLNF